LVAFAVFNSLRIFFKFKGSFISFASTIAGIGSVVLLCVSFFTFLNMPKSFHSDKFPTCQANILDFDYDKNNCDQLIGKNTNYLGDDGVTLQYMPGPGWWLLLGAIVFASVGAGQTLRSGKNSF